MKNRSDLFSIFQNFCFEIQNQFDVSIKMLHSDNAREYLSHPFNQFMLFGTWKVYYNQTSPVDISSNSISFTCGDGGEVDKAAVKQLIVVACKIG